MFYWGETCHPHEREGKEVFGGCEYGENQMVGRSGYDNQG